MKCQSKEEKVIKRERQKLEDKNWNRVGNKWVFKWKLKSKWEKTYQSNIGRQICEKKNECTNSQLEEGKESMKYPTKGKVEVYIMCSTTLI